MLGKLLLTGFVIWVAWLFWRKSQLKSNEKQLLHSLSHIQNSSKSQRYEGKMVRCEHCGVYLPEQEAICSKDRFFCCSDHRKLFTKANES